MAQIKIVGIILQDNQNIRPAFAYVEKISRSKFLKYDNFETNFFLKKRGGEFDYFAELYLQFEFKPSRMKRK